MIGEVSNCNPYVGYSSVLCWQVWCEKLGSILPFRRKRGPNHAKAVHSRLLLNDIMDVPSGIDVHSS